MVTLVLLGRLGSQEAGELAFHTPIVEVEKMVALGGTSLRGTQLQLLKGPNDGVEAGGAWRLDGGGS
jgi:hypothetical protein